MQQGNDYSVAILPASVFISAKIPFQIIASKGQLNAISLQYYPS